MRKKISVFLISLFTLTALVFTACNKDNPPTPETDCTDFAVTIQMQGNEYLVAVPSNGTGPYSFVWTDGSTSDSLQMNPAMAGTFAVTVTSADGCTASDTFEISVNPCTDFAVTIQMQGNEYLVAVPANGTSPYTFVWTDGSTNDSLQINPAMAGTFAVTVTSANGCTASDTFEITVDPCENFDVSLTVSGSIILAGAFGGEAPFIYAWSDGSTQNGITVTADGNYAVTVTDVNGCTATADFDYVANPCANSDLSVSFQFDSNPAGNTLFALPSGGTQPYNFLWSNSATDQFVSANTPGIYTVTVTDINGCTATGEYTVTADCAGFMVNIVRDNNITTSIHFDAVTSAGTSPFSYEWGGFGSGTASYVELANGTSGSISVTVTDANGCLASDNDQF